MRLIDADEAKKLEQMLTLKPSEKALFRLMLDRMPTYEPPNPPLTLDELREMDGEPVYDWMGYEWFVVAEVTDEDVIMTDGTVFDVDEESVTTAVGRFYRRKPEEVE